MAAEATSSWPSRPRGAAQTCSPPSAAGRGAGLETWALTGPAPNPLCDASERALAVSAQTTATIQEIHQVVVHLVCRAVDETVAHPAPSGRLAVAR